MVLTSLLAQVIAGATPAVLVTPDGQHLQKFPLPRFLLPGSFNPLHEGHLQLGHWASSKIGGELGFELCVRNVDKPALALEDVQLRLRQFAWKYPIWITSLPTFVAKAKHFPGSSFLVGADTALRILDPRYYENGEEGMKMALSTIAAHGCSFILGTRRDSTGKLLTLRDLPHLGDLGSLFLEIPPSEFQMDISSTHIRQQQRCST